LKNAHLRRRFPHPLPFNVPQSTHHGSGFRGPCIWAFLNSLQKRLFQHAAKVLASASAGITTKSADQTATEFAGLLPVS
jgi:hypothetical protein